MSRLCTYEEAATATGRSMRTIFRWCKQGKLRTVQDNGRVLVEIKDGDPLTDVAAKLTQVAGAGAIQRARDADILSLVVNDIRRSKRGAYAIAAIMSLATAGIWAQYTRETRNLDRQLVSAQHERDTATKRAEAAEVQAVQAVTAANGRTAAARQAIAAADQRAAAAEAQAAEDSARIAQINEALAGLADWEPWEQFVTAGE